MREVQIALIPRRATEQCPRAVIHQHEISDPDGEALAKEGVIDAQACVKTALFSRFNRFD